MSIIVQKLDVTAQLIRMPSNDSTYIEQGKIFQRIDLTHQTTDTNVSAKFLVPNEHFHIFLSFMNGGSEAMRQKIKRLSWWERLFNKF